MSLSTRGAVRENIISSSSGKARIYSEGPFANMREQRRAREIERLTMVCAGSMTLSERQWPAGVEKDFRGVCGVYI